MEMRVEFFKGDEGRLCVWTATPPKRRTFQGTTMPCGRDLPHDLAQFVVERALGVRDGFWGLLANGASFKSVPGRRPTKPGQALVRAHLDALYAVEGVANEHVTAWRQGRPTPVAPELDATYERWRALPVGEALSMTWPVHRLPAAGAPRRTTGGRRHASRSTLPNAMARSASQLTPRTASSSAPNRGSAVRPRANRA
jgi:hypothetical protein